MMQRAHTTLQQVILMVYFAWSILLVTHCVLILGTGRGTSGLHIASYVTYLGITAFLIRRYLFPTKKAMDQHLAVAVVPAESVLQDGDNEEHLSVEFLKDLLAIGEAGKNAHAKVLAVSEVGQYIDRHPFLKVRLWVTEGGKEPFDMQAFTLVSNRLIPRIGDSCRIRYLTHRQKTVLIVGLGTLDTDVI